MIPRFSWSTAGAAGVIALAIVAMFFDHMLDVEEPFPADAPAFVISVTLMLASAAIVFGVVVPAPGRALRPPTWPEGRNMEDLTPVLTPVLWKT